MRIIVFGVYIGVPLFFETTSSPCSAEMKVEERGCNIGRGMQNSALDKREKTLNLEYVRAVQGDL